MQSRETSESACHHRIRSQSFTPCRPFINSAFEILSALSLCWHTHSVPAHWLSYSKSTQHESVVRNVLISRHGHKRGFLLGAMPIHKLKETLETSNLTTFVRHLDWETPCVSHRHQMHATVSFTTTFIHQHFSNICTIELTHSELAPNMIVSKRLRVNSWAGHQMENHSQQLLRTYNASNAREINQCLQLSCASFSDRSTKTRLSHCDLRAKYMLRVLETT